MKRKFTTFLWFMLILWLIPFMVMSQQLVNDGPYIFREGEEWTTYTIKEGKVEKESLPFNRMAASFQVATDEPGQYFEVQLKPGISFELATYEKPRKIVAISDIEGNFGPFRKLLQSTGVMDDRLNWSFGDGHLVLTGDFFDRGAMVTEVLWLIYKLEWEAWEAGGHVHFILGNHEIMNLQGDFRYIHPKYKKATELLGKELIDLYSADTELGQWLRAKNILEKVGDHLFVHAGISGDVNALALSVGNINNIVRPYYDRDPFNAGRHARVLMSEQGPLWYRGYYHGRKASEVIDKTLEQYGVSRIITGHTVVADTISTWYNSKIINIDTRHAEGKSEALLIENGHYYRVDVNGIRKEFPVLSVPLQGSNHDIGVQND